MLSRVADAIFWMSRYYERAENTSRLIDVNINLMLDMGSALSDAGSSAPYWNPIIRITSPFGEFRAQHPKTTQDSALQWLAFGETNPNSMLNCVRRARENAHAIRGQISSEMWQQINATYLHMQGSTSADIWREGPHSYFWRIREASQLFQGMVNSTQLRDEAYQWMQLGKYLERADATTRLVDVKYHMLLPSVDEVGGPIDNVQWIAVLKSCSAYEAYQRRYVTRITPSRVAEFLVLDKSFPRAVRFCFDRIRWGLRSIASEHGAPEERAPELVASHVSHMLSDATMSGIVQFGLHEYMVQLQDSCSQVSHKITQTYFQGAMQHAS